MDNGRPGGFGDRRSFGGRCDEHDMHNCLVQEGDRMDCGDCVDLVHEDRGRDHSARGREKQRDFHRVRDCSLSSSAVKRILLYKIPNQTEIKLILFLSIIE